MSREDDNKAVVGRWFTHFWGKEYNPAIVDELAAPDMLLQYSLHAPRRGRDAIKAFMKDFRKAFPDLKGWATTSTACSAKWDSLGGYGEMSVVGESVLCDAVDDGAGNARVFNRVKYCPSTCTAGSTAAECKDCTAGGAGRSTDFREECR